MGYKYRRSQETINQNTRTINELANLLNKELEHSKWIESQLIAQGAETRERILEARADATERSRRVMRGLATEHLAPLINNNYNPRDMRFIGDPIDYVSFDGLSDLNDGIEDQIKEVVFVDIKSGKSSLSKAQRRIRDAIADGRVRFEVYNPDKTLTKLVETNDSNTVAPNNNPTP